LLGSSDLSGPREHCTDTGYEALECTVETPSWRAPSDMRMAGAAAGVASWLKENDAGTPSVGFKFLDLQH
jgi:hypothetical protein